MLAKVLLFVCLYFKLSAILAFTDTIFVKETKKKIWIGEQIQVFLDKTNKLTFADLLSEEYESKFKNLKRKNYIAKQPNEGNIWGRFILKNNTNQTKDVILGFLKTDTYQADLYWIDQQNLSAKLKTGIALSPEERNYQSLEPVFLLKLLPQESKLYYFKIYNPTFSDIKPFIVDEDIYRIDEQKRTIFWGIFYGVLFCGLLYNLFLFTIYPSKSFIYFILHIIFLCVHLVNTDGLGFLYLHNILRLAHGFQTLISIGLFLSFWWLFIKEYFNLKQKVPFADTLLKIAFFVSLSFSVLGLMELSWGFWVAIYSFSWVLLLLMYISWISYKYNLKEGYYLGIFNIFLIVLLLINVLAILDIIPKSDFTRWNFHWAALIELITMTIAFTWKVRSKQLTDILQINEIKEKRDDLEKEVISKEKDFEIKSEQLESIIESSSDYIYSFDKNLNLLTANTAALNRMRSYGMEINIGKHCQEIFPIEIYNFLMPLLQKTLDSGEPITIETKGRKLEGMPAVYYVMYFNPIFTKNKQITGVSLFIRDISSSVKTKKALLYNEMLLQTIFDSTPDSLFLINPENCQIERWNETAMSMFELESIDLVNIEKELEIPLSKKNLEKSIKNLEENKEWTNEIRYITRSGKSFWGAVKCTKIEITNKKYLLVRVTNIDIRKNSEEYIKSLNRLFIGILESTKDVIFAIDTNYRYTLFNQAHKKRMDYAYQTNIKIGDNILDHITNIKDNKNFRKDVETALKGKRVITERRYGTSEIFLNLFEAVYNPITNEQNEVKGVAIFIRDITERKEYEKTLKRKNADLKKVNAELDKFVYSASHDLRAPLSSIMGLINLTIEEDDETQKQFYYSLMQKSIQKLDDFIQQIVHYSRNARLKIKPEKIDLTEIITQSIENLQYMQNKDKITPIIENQLKYPVYTDKFRLSVVLNNLVSNAYRYADLNKEKPFVKIEAYHSNKYFVIGISDNGQGIDKKYLNKIFDMFFRASENNTGSGLGLYILKETLEVLGGNIEVQSTLGVGTTFIVKIPNLDKN